MLYIFGFLYITDIVLNLISADSRHPVMYAVTKVFLMPLLLLVYFASVPYSVRSGHNQLFLIMALSFHWLGDVLLLLPRKNGLLNFYAGAAAFFIGHIFYCIWFLYSDLGHSPLAMVVILPFVVLLEFFLCSQIGTGKSTFTKAFFFYSLGLMSLAVSAISTMGHGTPVWATLISLLGVGLFILSDLNIARITIGKPLSTQTFTQITYILGQTLIFLGIACLQYFKT